MEATWSTLAYCLTQQDTLNIIGDPANGNRYTYTGDDPVNNVDPKGQFSLQAFGLALVAYALEGTCVIAVSEAGLNPVGDVGCAVGILIFSTAVG